MDLNSGQIISFEVATDDDVLIKELVDYYNGKYDTLFKILDYEDRDGVVFAIMELHQGSHSDVFQLGCFFGMRVQYKRSNAEIDW